MSGNIKLTPAEQVKETIKQIEAVITNWHGSTRASDEAKANMQKAHAQMQAGAR